MGNNFLGTNIVILSTDEYRRLLTCEHKLNNLVEFVDGYWHKPECRLKIGLLREQIRKAWDAYTPSKKIKSPKARYLVAIEENSALDIFILTDDPNYVEEDEEDAGDGSEG
jgi:hypothetical protein